ncbi:MAG: hypothetical protein CVU06_02000 [Bacteroidetes bacterium HGW-Bacteroidetes-22]|nr:MAG: hypothetical protein CVU06_02000 [Bacteroidetes bacterium HGW-Bacteroidetes-22]
MKNISRFGAITAMIENQMIDDTFSDQRLQTMLRYNKIQTKKVVVSPISSYRDKTCLASAYYRMKHGSFCLVTIAQ